MHGRFRILLTCLIPISLCGTGLHAQTSVPAQPPRTVQPEATVQPAATLQPAATVQPVAVGPEARAARDFNAVRSNPLELRAFLQNMPKGADLHIHLSGAIYAETFIDDAVQDHLCIAEPSAKLSANSIMAKPGELMLDKPLSLLRTTPAQPRCAIDATPAIDALSDQKLYDALIDSFSMRDFVPSESFSGHDQFFATFARFSAISKTHNGEWLDEVATRAARQNEQYLEIMETPDFSHAAKIANEIGWDVDTAPSIAQPDFAPMRDALLAKGLEDDIAPIRKDFDEQEAQRNQREHCGEQDASPACRVAIRYLFQILRGLPPQQVFAQTLLGFKTALADPRIVGINFVMPEDGRISMADYHLQMQMIDYLHRSYPAVHISLHAGELAPGLVPPSGLRFHIREAVDLGHAERIGHGVDVMYEDQPYALLKEMAARHILVEINLTSNDVILGISGKQHPFPEYRKAHVPVALSTDDEGVSRIDLTHEYVRAVEEFGLGYMDLKQMARASLEHSFLPGVSLWQQPDVFTRVNLACARQAPGPREATGACLDFLNSSDKAAQQWELETRFRKFESDLSPPSR